MDRSERIAQLKEGLPNLKEFEMANGLSHFSAECDFCGDEPYKAAFQIARRLRLKVELVCDPESDPGWWMPVFRFRGPLGAMEKFAAWYG